MFTEEEGNRANVTDVLIIYTDGAASDKSLQIKEADLLKKNGVKIICIGFGSQSAVQKFLPDLEKMASPSCEGTGKLVFQADFHELETIANSIVQEACNCA
jgi:Asp/Glu/hydantoin racemase